MPGQRRGGGGGGRSLLKGMLGQRGGAIKRVKQSLAGDCEAEGEACIGGCRSPLLGMLDWGRGGGMIRRGEKPLAGDAWGIQGGEGRSLLLGIPGQRGEA